MIDSAEAGYMCPPVGPSELELFCRRVNDRYEVQMVADEFHADPHPVRWSGMVEGLGRVTLNVDGYLHFGGSLAKFRQRLIERLPEKQVHNNTVLTARQADETFQAVTQHVERLFDFAEPDKLNATRFDVVFQRDLDKPFETLDALKGAMVPTRKGCAWFDNEQGVPTGLILKGTAVAHRVYIKGLESGDPQFLNTLRSEEQLRKRAADFGRIYNSETRSFDREACREVLNNRYIDVAYAGDLDVSSLLAGGMDTMALLVLRPDLFPVYRERVKKNGYNKMRRKVREFRATAIPADLRVPAWAWLEDGEEEERCGCQSRYDGEATGAAAAKC